MTLPLCEIVMLLNIGSIMILCYNTQVIHEILDKSEGKHECPHVLSSLQSWWHHLLNQLNLYYHQPHMHLQALWIPNLIYYLPLPTSNNSKKKKLIGFNVYLTQACTDPNHHWQRIRDRKKNKADKGRQSKTEGKRSG